MPLFSAISKFELACKLIVQSIEASCLSKVKVAFSSFSTEYSTGLWKWSHHSLPRFCQDLRNVQLTLPKIALSRMRRPRTTFLEMAVEFGPRPLDRILKEVAGNYIAPVTSRGATSSTGIKLSKL